MITLLRIVLGLLVALGIGLYAFGSDGSVPLVGFLLAVVALVALIVVQVLVARRRARSGRQPD